MLFLQFIAAIVLIPLGLLMVVIFNVYLTNWIYLACITVFAAIFSLVFGLAFASMATAICIFFLMIIFYVLRMRYLAQQFYSKYNNKSYRALKGKIKSKNFNWRAELYFPLQFLHLLRLLPQSMSQRLMEKTNINIEIPELVDRVLFYSLGTQIEIVNDKIDLYLEVQ